MVKPLPCCSGGLRVHLPKYDILALGKAICEREAWNLIQTRFYTGIPDPADDRFWHQFWPAKLAVMGRQGMYVFSRPLRYRNRIMKLPSGGTHSLLAGEEKGIDVRIVSATPPPGQPQAGRGPAAPAV